jgi:Family of unknown function (DUF6459)
MADSIPPTSSTGSAPHGGPGGRLPEQAPRGVPDDRHPGRAPRPLVPIARPGWAEGRGPVPRAGRDGRRRGASRVSRRSPGGRPLPDATSIYAVAVPEAAPPYDDAPLAPAARRLLVERSTQPPPAQPPVSPAPAAQPAPGQSLAVSGAWPSKFAQVLAETLAGSRPPDQIVPWTTEQTRRRIGQLGPLLATAHRPRVRRLLVMSPASGVLEMTVIVGLGPRVRAVAVRLERAGKRQSGARGSGVLAGPVRPTRASASSPFSRQTRPGGSEVPGVRLGEEARWRCTAVEAA